MICVHDILRQIKGNDALVEQHDPVKVTGCLIEVMRCHHHGDILGPQRIQ